MIKKEYKKGFIFSALAMVGVGASVALSSAAGIKAQKRLEERKPQTRMERFKTVFPCYISTLLATLATEVCIVAANGAYMEEIATISAVAVAGKEKFKEYRQAAVDVVGEDKEREIAERAADIHLRKSSYDVDEVEHVFHSDFMGEDAYYCSTMDEVRDALNEMNRTLAAGSSRWGGYLINEMDNFEDKYRRTAGFPVVEDYYRLINRKDLIDHVTGSDDAGWCLELLWTDYEEAYLPFEIIKKVNTGQVDDRIVPIGDVYFDIYTYIPVDENIFEAYRLASEDGRI